MVKLYEVGGSVRNELLGFPSRDVDYAIEVKSCEEFKKWVEVIGATIIHEHKEFHSYKLRVAKRVMDVTFCRTDNSYSDGRHPDSVQMGTLETDIQRRDFTMNALARECDPLTFARCDVPVIDFVGGHQDIARKVIRCVGHAKDRLYEDPLRLLRAIRFHITLGFAIDDSIQTLFGDHDLVDKLMQTVSMERVASEVALCLQVNALEFFRFLSYHSYFMQRLIQNLQWKCIPTKVS